MQGLPVPAPAAALLPAAFPHLTQLSLHVEEGGSNAPELARVLLAMRGSQLQSLKLKGLERQYAQQEDDTASKHTKGVLLPAVARLNGLTR
jgi:hypothetical protein